MKINIRIRKKVIKRIIKRLEKAQSNLPPYGYGNPMRYYYLIAYWENVLSGLKRPNMLHNTPKDSIN